jgi:YHS domain-containing protein
VSGGMKIMPDYTFTDAPAPKLIVIPAQSGAGQAMIEWIRSAAKTADVTMSICTGVFVLAQTGLLSGRSATTHHGSYADLAMQYPDIRVKRGYRFVDEGNVASSGGLTCGIDLAFHIVERYSGRKRAEQTALNMEYQGRGLMDASGADNALYAKAFAGMVCPVCGMPVNPKSSPESDYKGHSYFFCSSGHKALFDKSPESMLELNSTG